MSKKFYVVWKGAKTGVFSSWSEVQSYTSGRRDAQFMGFPSKSEAEAAYASTYTKALMKRSLANNGTSFTATNSQQISRINDKTNKIQAAEIQIYCDGACSPNPGKAGTGFAIYHQGKINALYYGLYQPFATNNIAELNGLLHAFILAKKHFVKSEKIQILSDSKYSIDSITLWAKGWHAKGWTRGKGEEIKNVELIKECFALYQDIKKRLIITHVKGHANIEGNELADRMAVLARTKQQVELVKYEGELDVKMILAMESG
mgnify:CR=1 FL=1